MDSNNKLSGRSHAIRKRVRNISQSLDYGVNFKKVVKNRNKITDELIKSVNNEEDQTIANALNEIRREKDGFS